MEKETVVVQKIGDEQFVNLVPAVPSTPIAISADTIALALNRYIDSHRMTGAEKSLILWFFTHVKDKGLSMSEAAEAIRYTPSTLSRLFAGKYEGSLENVVEAIRNYKQIMGERYQMTHAEFIETSIWDSIRSLCDLALVRQVPVRVVGVSQIGKTRALQEYQRRSQFRVLYCRMPAVPSVRNVVETLATVCKVNATAKTDRLVERITKALDENTLLIIDELHELAMCSQVVTATRCVETIRRIHDMSHCGLVLCGTKVMEDELINGAKRGWMDQLAQRCCRVLNLPDRLPEKDIMLTINTYGMPKPDQNIAQTLRTLRMNHLCLCLNMTIDTARRKGIEPDWPLFCRVLATLRGND